MRELRRMRWISFIQRSKLSTLMVACFIFLNLLFLIVIDLLAYQAFSRVTFKEISSARLSLLNENTKRGFDFITYVTEAAYSIVTNKEVISRLENPGRTRYDLISSRRDLSDLLRHIRVVNTNISSVWIYSNAYNDVAYGPADLVYPIDRISREPWFPGLAKADGMWVPVWPNAPDKSVIHYVQRIPDDKGNTIGYVSIGLTREEILQKFADTPMDPEGRLLLVDTGGKVIGMVNNPGDSGGKGIVSPEWLEAHAFNFGDGYEVMKKGGRSYLVLFSKPSSLQWRLVQVVPVRSLLTGTEQAGWYVFAAGLVSLLLSAGLAYVFVKNMITPLRRLMIAMKKLERGDFDARVNSSFTEEYVQLSSGFNHMAGRLRQLVERVKRENRARREAQTSLLEAQIKPHFLYNTLDMIYWRALDYKAEDISQMIMQLGKLLRIGLSGGKMFIRLRDELEHARCYVEIQRIRQPFPIEYKEETVPYVKGCYTPKVILQPFIENSVIHGKPAAGSGEALKLHLRIREEPLAESGKRAISLELTDNGGGLPEGWTLASSRGIGIRNVHNRIRLYCGPPYGVEMANREDGPGVRVTIRIPVIEKEEQLHDGLDGEDA